MRWGNLRCQRKLLSLRRNKIMASNKRFFVGLLLLIIAVVGLTFLLKLSMPQIVTSFWWALMLFFVIVSVVVYLITMKIRAKNDFRKFNNFYMLATVIKLLLYLSIVTMYSFICSDDSKAFIITFLIYYLCFTVFETLMLVKNKN